MGTFSGGDSQWGNCPEILEIYCVMGLEEGKAEVLDVGDGGGVGLRVGETR